MRTLVAAVRSDAVADAAGPGLSPTAARAALVRLCAAGFVAYCSYSICRAPLLPLFARELGAGPSLIGFVMGASTLTGVFLKLPAGALSDLFGRRRLLVAGALVFATLPFSYLAVSTLAWLVVLRFLHGSATAIFGPVASASLSDFAPASRRGAWLSTVLHGSRRRPGYRADPGRICHRRWSVRSCVRRLRTHRSRRPAHCRHVARSARWNVCASVMAGVQAGRQ